MKNTGRKSQVNSVMVFVSGVLSTPIHRSLHFLARHFSWVVIQPMFMLVQEAFLKTSNFLFLVPAPPG
jgi:hypothetical protein